MVVSDDLPPSSQPGTLSFTFPWSRSPSYESKHASLSPVPSLSYPHPSHASTRRRRIRGPNWTRLIKSFAPAFAGVIVGCEMTLFSQLKDSKRWIEMMGGVRQEEFTKSEFGTDDKLGGMLMVGQIVGAGSAMYIADGKGRKPAMFFACFISLIGLSIQVGSSAWVSFCVGKIITGISIGLLTVIINLYQAECASPRLRGTIVSSSHWTMPLGIGLAELLGGPCWRDTEHCNPRLALGIPMVLPAVLACIVLLLPESPRWLLLRSQEPLAISELSSLTGLPPTSPSVLTEIASIKADVALSPSYPSHLRKFFSLFSRRDRHLLLRTLTSLGLILFQQLISVLFASSWTDYEREGRGLITSLRNLAMGIPGMILVEVLGRRLLLLKGSVLMTVCHIALGIILRRTALSERESKGTEVLQWSRDTLYLSSWGTVPWVTVSEIFPSTMRTYGLSLSSAWTYLFNYLGTFSWKVNGRDQGIQSGVNFAKAGVSLLGTLFVWWVVPETAALSLEQIDRLYENSKPRDSVKKRVEILKEAKDEKEANEKDVRVGVEMERVESGSSLERTSTMTGSERREESRSPSRGPTWANEEGLVTKSR